LIWKGAKRPVNWSLNYWFERERSDPYNEIYSPSFEKENASGKTWSGKTQWKKEKKCSIWRRLFRLYYWCETKSVVYMCGSYGYMWSPKDPPSGFAKLGTMIKKTINNRDLIFQKKNIFIIFLKYNLFHGAFCSLFF